MINPVFKKTIFISLLGHITILGIFNFTFGNRIFKADYAHVSFLGSILRSSDLSSRIFTQTMHARRVFFSKKPNMSALNRANKEYISVLRPYLKPWVFSTINGEKIMLTPAKDSISFIQKRKEPVIMFYPSLPYHFLLYFKDRQRAHIELAFNVISGDKTNTTLIKRKISSGNLEVDLLSMRYISHYLFIQQARFTPNKWQAVKIDLSAKND